MTIYIYLSRAFSVITLITLLGSLLMPSVSMSTVPILQPGAPGNATREIDAETAVGNRKLRNSQRFYRPCSKQKKIITT